MTEYWRIRLFSQLRNPYWMGFLLVNPFLVLNFVFIVDIEFAPQWVVQIAYAYISISAFLLLVRTCVDPIGQILPILVTGGLIFLAYKIWTYSSVFFYFL